MLTNNFTFHSPVTAHFGAGSKTLLPGLLAGYNRIGVISGATSLDKTGMRDFLISNLSGKDLHFFTKVEPNPSIETTLQGAELLQQQHCQVVLAVGGGSALDAGKAMAALATNNQDFQELLGLDRFPVQPLPTIAVPTTCGTGSEMNHYAILTDLAQQDKLNFSAANTFASHAILDPELLLSLSPKLVTATAFDALTHALEGYVSLRANPFTDTLALASMESIIATLTSSQDHKDIASLGQFLYNSALAGTIILHTGTTLLHALGYYLTNHQGIHHGTANSMLLPAFLNLLADNQVEKYKPITSLFAKYDFKPENFLKQMGGPATLTEIMDENEIQTMVEYAISKKNTEATPFPADPQKIIIQLHKLEPFE